MSKRYFVFETKVIDSGKATECAEVVHIQEYNSYTHAMDAAKDDRHKQLVVMEDIQGTTFWELE